MNPPPGFNEFFNEFKANYPPLLQRVSTNESEARRWLMQGVIKGEITYEYALDKLAEYCKFCEHMGYTQGENRRFIKNMANVAQNIRFGTVSWEIPEPEGSAAHQGGPERKSALKEWTASELEECHR